MLSPKSHVVVMLLPDVTVAVSRVVRLSVVVLLLSTLKPSIDRSDTVTTARTGVPVIPRVSVIASENVSTPGVAGAVNVGVK